MFVFHRNSWDFCKRSPKFKLNVNQTKILLFLEFWFVWPCGHIQLSHIHTAVTELGLLPVEVRGDPWGYKVGAWAWQVTEGLSPNSIAGPGVCKSLFISEPGSSFLKMRIIVRSCVSQNCWKDQKENMSTFIKQDSNKHTHVCVYQEHILKNNKCVFLLGGIQTQISASSLTMSLLFVRERKKRKV